MADSDDEHEQHFERSSSGASMTYPVQCSALRKNGHVVIKGRPCKIVEITTTNSHGKVKVHLIAIDIFTGKRLEEFSSSTNNMDVPNVGRREYQLVNIDDGVLNLMADDGNSKDDVKVPEGDLGMHMQADFENGKDLLVTIVGAMGEEAAISYKERTQTN